MIVQSKFLVGLASYLRQAALSLDRVPAHDLSSLIDFYEEAARYAPQDVLEKLVLMNHREGSRLSIGDGLGLLSHTRIKVYPHLYFAEKVLRRFETLLVNRNQWQQAVINDIRIELAMTSSLLEEKVYQRYDKQRISQVFHLNHADHLKMESVEEIAGVDWLAGQE